MSKYDGMTVKALREERVRRGWDRGGDRTKGQLIAAFQRDDAAREQRRKLEAGPTLLVPFRSADLKADRFRELQREHGARFEYGWRDGQFVCFAPPEGLVRAVCEEFEGAVFSEGKAGA